MFAVADQNRFIDQTVGTTWRTCRAGTSKARVSAGQHVLRSDGEIHRLARGQFERDVTFG
jgi:hypothetical protein